MVFYASIRSEERGARWVLTPILARRKRWVSKLMHVIISFVLVYNSNPYLLYIVISHDQPYYLLIIFNEILILLGKKHVILSRASKV